MVVNAQHVASAVESGFRAHQRYLWSLLLRMTGCAADADDLVQETFVRTLEQPPSDLDASLRPWLVRVGMNLARDLLRRRKRSGYTGPWLPSPVPTEDALPAHELVDRDGISTEGRYDMIESVSFAFLLALEALTPAQRAVLLLRDVFDYSATETGEALGMSEAVVRTTHHRARKAMARYDARRAMPMSVRKERTRDALTRFIGALLTGDVAAVESQLAADVTDMSDGGGEYLAARRMIFGGNRVARYMLGISPEPGVQVKTTPCELNGLPALLFDFEWTDRPRAAPRVVLACDINDEGNIAAFYTVLASRKLTQVKGCC
jgi:RNA polymerase sigma-70 factor, ECF subfamily